MTLSLIEIGWTFFSLVGVVLSAYNLVDVITDRKVLDRSKLNGLRKLVADSNIRSESLRLFVLCNFAVIGIASLLRVNTPEQVSLASWLLRMGLIASNIAIVYNTLADRVLRHRLFRYVDTPADKERKTAEYRKRKADPNRQ